MNDLEAALRTALDELGRRAPHRSDLADRARRGVRRSRFMTIGPAAAVVAVLVVLGSVWLSRPGASSGPAAPATSACSALLTAPPPVWARSGFTGDTYPPFAYSTSGNLVAIVFGNPLVAPPAKSYNNKILWVTKEPPGAGAFVITGHLEGSDRTATIDAGTAPGPSIIDMPAPGCWHLDLSWAGGTDSIDLRWTAG